MAAYGTSGQRRAENLAALGVTPRPTPEPVDVLGIVLAVIAVALGLPSLIQGVGLATWWASLTQAPGDNVVLVLLGLSVSPATLSGIVAVVLGGIVASRAASGRGARTCAVVAMAFGLATPLVAGLALGVSALT